MYCVHKHRERETHTLTQVNSIFMQINKISLSKHNFSAVNAISFCILDFMLFVNLVYCVCVCMCSTLQMRRIGRAYIECIN